MTARLVLLVAMILPLLGCGKNAIHFMREGGPVAQVPAVEQTATLRKLWRRDLGAGYQKSNFLLKNPYIVKNITKLQTHTNGQNGIHS